MPEEIIGPWRREDYESFIAFEDEYSPKIQNALSLATLLSPNRYGSRSSASFDRDGAVKVWALHRKHPIYIWLESQENFRKLWRVFLQLQSRATPNSPLAEEAAPFKLLHVLVEQAFWFFRLKDVHARFRGRESGFGPTAPRRRAAIKHVNSLLELCNKGVCLSGMDQREFERYLIKFRDQMKEVQRKPRGDAGTFIRDTLGFTAYFWYCDLRMSSPAIIEHFAALLDADCDYRTAQRHCSNAKLKHKEMVAEVLNKQTGQVTSRS